MIFINRQPLPAACFILPEYILTHQDKTLFSCAICNNSWHFHVKELTNQL